MKFRTEIAVAVTAMVIAITAIVYPDHIRFLVEITVVILIAVATVASQLYPNKMRELCEEVLDRLRAWWMRGKENK